MFGIGSSEFLLIMLVAVLVLGPEHLPKLVRTFGKVMADVRRVSTDFQRTINLEANQEEYRQRQKEQRAKQRKEQAARRAEAEAVAAAEAAAGNAEGKPAAAAAAAADETTGPGAPAAEKQA